MAYILAAKANPDVQPFYFLTCGDQEGQLPANRRFAALLEKRNFRYEFHVVPGGHNWTQWDARIPECFRALLNQMSTS